MPGISRRQGRLWIERISAESAARRFGTPLYVYSSGRVLERLAALREAFQEPRPLVCYALKANPNKAVAGLLARAGCGAEVVSGGELARAKAAGFDPRKTLFSGVGKTDEELAAAVRAGLFCVNVESSDELGRLGAVAARMRKKARFAPRVNPGVEAGAHEHVAVGRADSKFGLSPREAAALCRRGGPWLEAAGVHCHVGSQILAAGPYRKALKAALGVVEAMRARGLRPSHLDMGGGMGISYDGGPELDVRALAETIEEAVRARGLTLVLEPGRWLTADAGVLLTRVVRRKTSRGRRFAIVDAAMNDLLRPALYGARHSIVPAGPSRGGLVTLDVVGPVCESADVLGRARRLPWPEEGDLWAVLEAGAYGASMSSQYNSRPRAAEVLVAGSRMRLIRRRETLRDLVRGER